MAAIIPLAKKYALSNIRVECVKLTGRLGLGLPDQLFLRFNTGERFPEGSREIFSIKRGESWVVDRNFAFEQPVSFQLREFDDIGGSDNIGTVDIGSPNNSTADLVRQIRYGLNDFDMSFFPNREIRFDKGPITLNGDTGLSAGIKDDLWKFAIVGTLLAMLQLLVYSALARRQGRAVIAIWTALVVLVGLAVSLATATSLVLTVVAVDGVLFAALFALAATAPSTSARTKVEAKRG